MSEKTIGRTGETAYNKFGSEMIIIDYKGCMDVDVYFPEYNWTFKEARYGNFKKGSIKCPYERRYYEVGYLGEGKYKVSENGKHTKVYQTWHDMLRRCYDEKSLKRNPTYIGCKVDKEFHNFQEYGEWSEDNYYEIKEEKMCLDKDILVKHNKIYSPETCIFVPQRINTLFTKRDSKRGNNPIGVSDYINGKYVAQCHIINPETGKSKYECLGVYETQLKAFEVYKEFKEKNIRQVADYYFGLIPNKLYNTLYNYEVEITD